MDLSQNGYYKNLCLTDLVNVFYLFFLDIYFTKRYNTH